MRRIFRMGVLLAALAGSASSSAQQVAGQFPAHWNQGSTDCEHYAPPPLEVEAYNSSTYILRESLCQTYEGNFLYLLIGTKRALLIDTGDVEDPAQMPLARTVEGILARTAPGLPLLVLHTHGHLDHRAGDGQFAGPGNVEVVPSDLVSITRYFGWKNWPNEQAQIDLGGRIVDVLPTPGHHEAHLVFYDRQTQLLFSGDMLLPGRLLIADTAADLASARRLASFGQSHPITYALGGHIELDRAGKTFLGVNYHPDERPLQLTAKDVADLPSAIAAFNGIYSRHGDYLMINQNRVLTIYAACALLALALIGWGIGRWWRIRKLNKSRG